MAKLRFFCRGTANVEDVHAANRERRPVRRMIGRRHQEVIPGTWALGAIGEAQEVDYHHDLVKACRDDNLWAADEETAKACGVGFDPDFGGEVTETIKAFKAKKAAEDAAAKAAAAPAPIVDEKKTGKSSGGKAEG